MKRYTVEITDEAMTNMDEIYNHISNVLLSPVNAMRQYNRIADAILKLDIMPERFRIVECEPEHSNELRSSLYSFFSIFD